MSLFAWRACYLVANFGLVVVLGNVILKLTSLVVDLFAINAELLLLESFRGFKLLVGTGSVTAVISRESFIFVFEKSFFII